MRNCRSKQLWVCHQNVTVSAPHTAKRLPPTDLIMGAMRATQARNVRMGGASHVVTAAMACMSQVGAHDSRCSGEISIHLEGFQAAATDWTSWPRTCAPSGMEASALAQAGLGVEAAALAQVPQLAAP